MLALLVFALALTNSTRLPAADLFVSPTGDDAHPGTSANPFATLTRANQAARRFAGREPVTVHVRGGTYYLTAPLVLGPSDSGTAAAPVNWLADSNHAPVLSGGIKLSPKWEPFRDGIWQASVPAGTSFDQLFINGELQVLARYPNRNPAERIFQGYAADAIAPERSARWKDPRGAFLHAMHKHEWGGFHYVVTGRDAKGELTLEGGWQNNRRMGMHDQQRFVENVFEELDAPGEWFLDASKRQLFFHPPAGLDLKTALVEGVRLRHLIEFRGTREQPVRHIRLQGLTFRHTQRTFMDNKEPLLRSDWTTYRGGAVLFQGAEDCSLEGSTFDQVGGNAVFVDGYNRRLQMRELHIFKAGGNGIAFVGSTNAVRSPLLEYSQRQTLTEINRFPGPRTADFPSDCLVDDCLIHETGRVEKQTAPIQIAMSSRITVRNCSLYDVPRAGINIGDGCWGGHLIEHCDVFDTVRETGDHGSFNSWGRDRYWLPGIKEVDALVAEHPELPKLDAMETTTLRHNRWRCDHGWDIDLDDGSSNYLITENLCLNGGLKLREGFHRVVENNIIVNNSFHPHVWYAKSGDVFRRNIVMTWYRPIGMPTNWGSEINGNLLPDDDALARSRKLGLDTRSVAGDPRFTDPAKGDYTLATNSPALAIGFMNFDMAGFGVRSGRLRALARTPVLPTIKLASASPAATTPGTPATLEWLGARWKRVTEMGEVSAAGLPGPVGILLVERPDNSAAARLGFRPMDVILDWHGDTVKAAAELPQRYGKLKAGEAAVLRLFRQQRETTLELPAPSR